MAMTTSKRRELLENFLCELDDAVGLIENFQLEIDGLWAEIKLAAKREKLIGKLKPVKTLALVDHLYETRNAIEDALYDLPPDESEDDDEEAEEDEVDDVHREPVDAPLTSGISHDVGNEPDEGAGEGTLMGGDRS